MNPRSAAWVGFVALWLGGAGMGYAHVVREEGRAGIAGQAPAVWPQTTSLQRVADRSTLVMFVHPKCPCSRASAAELERLMARSERLLDTWVVIAAGRDATGRDLASSIRERFAAIPGVHVVDDAGGIESKRFGAATSGQAVVYDASGRLRFAGGLTAARGHEGPNGGVTAVLAIARADASRATARGGSVATSSVFGCGLEASTRDKQ